MNTTAPQPITIEARRPVDSLELTHWQRWAELRQNLSTLAIEAGKADKNAYLRIGGKSTLAARIAKAVEDTDKLVMELVQQEALDE